MAVDLFNGTDTFFNLRAPPVASANRYLNAEGKVNIPSLYGCLVVGVPGTVFGIETACA